jgi:hypothetical protein
MADNVGEWTSTRAHGQHGVFGLSWQDYKAYSQSPGLSLVGRAAPTIRDASLGFRCARESPPLWRLVFDVREDTQRDEEALE